MGETSSDSDSGSGSESSANTWDLLLSPNSFGEIAQLAISGKLICDSKAQVNLGSISSRESETNLPLKGNQHCYCLEIAICCG